MPRVVFVDLFPSIFDQHGIYSLAAVCKKEGIDVDYICSSDRNRVLKQTIAAQPDFVLYSSFSATTPDYIAFDAELKKHQKDIRSVIGGPGPTFDYQSYCNTTISAICVGEGELALPAYIKSDITDGNIFNGTMPFQVERLQPFVELDSLPFPDRTVVYQKDPLRRDKQVKHFLSGRGCPYQCTFCFNHAYHKLFKDAGKVIRKKSVDYFIEEIKHVQKVYGFTSVSFSDDTFILDKQWLSEFCYRFLKEIQKPFTCGIRANLMDDDTARILCECGCHAVNWSIEAGNGVIRNTVLKRNMTDEQIIRTAELLTKYKIPYWTGNIIASPSETFDNMYETVGLNIKVKPRYALAKIFTPYPGLELTKYAVKNGYYNPENKTGRDDLFSKSLLNYSEKENVNIQKLMALFPLFVSFPFVFENSILRTALFVLPRFFLRILYEIYTGFSTMQLYIIKMPLTQRFQLMCRYLGNLK